MSKLMSCTLAFKVALCWEFFQVTSKQCFSVPSTMVICRCSKRQVRRWPTSLEQDPIVLLSAWTFSQWQVLPHELTAILQSERKVSARQAP